MFLVSLYWLSGKNWLWQLPRKILILRKTPWHIMYIHCGLWNVPNQQQFKTVKLKLISESNMWSRFGNASGTEMKMYSSEIFSAGGEISDLHFLDGYRPWHNNVTINNNNVSKIFWINHNFTSFEDLLESAYIRVCLAIG